MQSDVLKDAKRYVKEWAYRLRLQDWKFIVKVAGSELEAFATCDYNVCHGIATIKVRDPIHMPDYDKGFCNDLEVSIVHEMLHLRFKPIEQFIDDKELKAPKDHEASIELTAQALVSAARGYRRLF